ncbi:hypothetical protein FOCC_FOCC014294 [Frankliniella occidentalis]|nr:hypothetical protein FOCC_FOCC014294 [Frankliniella occidentalis]
MAGRLGPSAPWVPADRGGRQSQRDREDRVCRGAPSDLGRQRHPCRRAWRSPAAQVLQPVPRRRSRQEHPLLPAAQACPVVHRNRHGPCHLALGFVQEVQGDPLGQCRPEDPGGQSCQRYRVLQGGPHHRARPERLSKLKFQPISLSRPKRRASSSVRPEPARTHLDSSVSRKTGLSSQAGEPSKAGPSLVALVALGASSQAAEARVALEALWPGSARSAHGAPWSWVAGDTRSPDEARKPIHAFLTLGSVRASDAPLTPSAILPRKSVTPFGSWPAGDSWISRQTLEAFRSEVALFSLFGRSNLQAIVARISRSAGFSRFSRTTEAREAWLTKETRITPVSLGAAEAAVAGLAVPSRTTSVAGGEWGEGTGVLTLSPGNPSKPGRPCCPASPITPFRPIGPVKPVLPGGPGGPGPMTKKKISFSRDKRQYFDSLTALDVVDRTCRATQTTIAIGSCQSRQASNTLPARESNYAYVAVQASLSGITDVALESRSSRVARLALRACKMRQLERYSWACMHAIDGGGGDANNLRQGFQGSLELPAGLPACRPAILSRPVIKSPCWVWRRWRVAGDGSHRHSRQTAVSCVTLLSLDATVAHDARTTVRARGSFVANVTLFTGGAGRAVLSVEDGLPHVAPVSFGAVRPWKARPSVQARLTAGASRTLVAGHPRVAGQALGAGGTEARQPARTREADPARVSRGAVEAVRPTLTCRASDRVENRKVMGFVPKSSFVDIPLYLSVLVVRPSQAHPWSYRGTPLCHRCHLAALSHPGKSYGLGLGLLTGVRRSPGHPSAASGCTRPWRPSLPWARASHSGQLCRPGRADPAHHSRPETREGVRAEAEITLHSLWTSGAGGAGGTRKADEAGRASFTLGDLSLGVGDRARQADRPHPGGQGGRRCRSDLVGRGDRQGHGARVLQGGRGSLAFPGSHQSQGRRGRPSHRANLGASQS